MEKNMQSFNDTTCVERANEPVSEETWLGILIIAWPIVKLMSGIAENCFTKAIDNGYGIRIKAGNFSFDCPPAKKDNFNDEVDYE